MPPAAPQPAPPAPLRIAVAGMGLIGGSLYKAAQRAGHRVVGFDRGDPVDVRSADVVFVALPPQTAVDWVLLHAPEYKPGAVVVDTCGVKGPVCRPLFAAAAGRPWTFVGGHPMAGKEVSGFANSTPDLFRNASMILVPPPSAPPDLLRRLAALFDGLGFARTVLADPDRHDQLIAYTSQLCHLASSAYLRDPLAPAHAGFSAGSFRDLVRVGAPDPALWTELFTANRDALLPVLDRYIARLAAFRAALAADDRPALAAQLAEGAAAKRALQTAPPPPTIPPKSFAAAVPSAAPQPQPPHSPTGN